jgi:hypothetical protein
VPSVRPLASRIQDPCDALFGVSGEVHVAPYGVGQRDQGRVGGLAGSGRSGRSGRSYGSGRSFGSGRSLGSGRSCRAGWSFGSGRTYES